MNEEIAQKVAVVLKAVAHPVRLNIIELLENKELSVGQIVDSLNQPQAVISQHLVLMKDKGVLDCRRDGKRVIYEIRNKNVINLLHCVYSHCDNNGTQNLNIGV